jgi:asparagine synthase (glutamine-hydrolysing)
MCGIAGYFDPGGTRQIATPLLRAMGDSLAHRGPDGSDLWQAPGVGLAHRRLAVIDVAGSPQPMHAIDGDAVIVFNGEIYNYAEVRDELRARGHRFRTQGDTEVVLEAWRAWGEACVERLRGMFAFAVYDLPKKLLFLARDRLGVKPLHYALLPNGTLIFGSELKVLLLHPSLPREIDPTAIEDYFAYGYVPDPKSILASVRKLEAGHLLTFAAGARAPVVRRYWDVDFRAKHRGKPRDLAAELVERMRAAVKLRMVADVPVGAFLSGGVDSSAVVALMSGIDPRPVETCSIGFDVPGYDESAHAAEVARRYATNHRNRVVDSTDFSLVDRLVEAFDEPFADASALPTFRVCELARERVTVALSGDGADEVLAGYRRYRMHAAEDRVRRLLPGGVRAGLFGPLGRHFPKLDWAPRPFRAKTTFEALSRDAASAYFNSVAVTPNRVRDSLFSADFRRELGGYRADALYIDTIRAAPADDALGAAQYADVKHWLPGDILTKVDRTSMAVSLEAREPLLDHELVEWCAGLPASMKLRGGEGKWLLKKAMEPFLPKPILYRPKMGFVVPVAEWLRGDLGSEIDGGGAWCAPGFVAEALAAHRSGRAEHGRLLWQVLMLDRSLKRLQRSRPFVSAA